MPSANKKNAILQRWEETFAERGDAPAVFAPDGRVLRTFADVENEARSLTANELKMVAPRSVLAIQVGNCASWPALLLAAFRCELIPLPLGRHIEKAERDNALQTCDAAALIESEHDELKLSTIGERQSAIDADFLKLTSGTTAAPRAIRFRAEQLVADCDNICESMGIRSDDVNFGVIPFSHSYGFSNLLTPLLCRGVALVASEDRMPRAILDGLVRSGATVFPGMPVFFEKFGGMENVLALPQLRLCISAGAPLTKRVAERFSEKFALKIHTFYGSSECGGIGYDAGVEFDYEDGFAGQPMNNVHIAPLESGDVSRIEICSDAVGEGYLPTSEPDVLGGGRFIPGDLIRFTKKGMFITGRASDVINVAGRKLNPAEVEAQLSHFSGVKHVVVFGIPSALRNEEAIACVAGEVTANDVLHFARTVLSGWQVPKDVWIVDEIPVSERGKISRRELARRYLEKHDC